MGSFEFECPACEAGMEADDSFRGQDVRCPACGTSFIAPEITVVPGLVIDGYKVERRLGVGGMGEVWLARQQALGRDVAIKILSPKFTRDPEFVSRFMQEVKMVGKLSHPNIITAYSAGTDQGVKYLAVEFVDGVELGNRMKIDRHLPERYVLQIAKKIAEALNYAWTKFKVLHRDIKPENIMINADGEPKLMDLGISKSLTDDSSLTMTGVVIGTPYYMSPEQARADKRIDCRVDIYSLGATLFHMLAGEVPYDGPTAMSIISKHMAPTPVPSPKDFNPEVTPQCVALIKKMMAKNPEDRQDDWEEVLSDLDLVLEGKFPASAAPAPSATHSRIHLNRKQVKEAVKPAGEGRLASGGKKLASAALGLILTAAVGFLLYELLKAKGYFKPPAPPAPAVAAPPFVQERAESPSPLLRAEPPPRGEPGTIMADVSEKTVHEWESAKALVEDAMKRSSGFDLALDALERLAKSPDGPKLSEAIAPAKAMLLDAKAKSRLKRVLSGLNRDAEMLASSGNPAAAVKTLKEYSGELKDETQEERLRLAAKYEEQAKLKQETAASSPERQGRKQKPDKHPREYVSALVKAISDGDADEALAQMEAACAEPFPDDAKERLEGMLELCRKLKKSESELLESLKKDQGKTLELEVSGKKGAYKIFAVEGSKLSLVQGSGPNERLLLGHAMDIAPANWFERVDCPAEVKALLQGRYAYKSGDLASAANFCRGAGALAEPLHKELKLKGQQEADSGGRLSPFIPQEPKTDSAQQQEPPAAKEAAAPKPEIRQLLKGKVVRFDPKTLAIEINYEFNDAKELEDWITLPNILREDAKPPVISGGKMLIDAPRGRALYVLKAKFDSIESVKSSCVFQGNGIMQGIGVPKGSSLTFVCSGFGTGADGYLKSFGLEERPQLQQLRASEAKPDKKTDLELFWKDGRASFSINRKSLATIQFAVQGGCCLWIGAARGRNEYSALVVKGKLDRSWFEAECSPPKP